MAKKLPAPFKRPSIDLGAPSKAWRTVHTSTLQEGDIVPDCGAVVAVETQYRDPAGYGVRFLSGKSHLLGVTVWAFTAAPEA